MIFLQVEKELKRFNLILYRNVLATEQTIPCIACVTMFFILMVISERNFIIAVFNLIFSKYSIVFQFQTNDLLAAAKWSEYQVKTIKNL